MLFFNINKYNIDTFIDNQSIKKMYFILSNQNISQIRLDIYQKLTIF